jgi:serine/threonine protein kinase
MLQKCLLPEIVAYYGCIDTPSTLLVRMALPDADPSFPLYTLSGYSLNAVFSCYVQIVMEYCACGSLLDLMHACKRTLTEAQISAAMWGVLTGLSHLHEKKIIHRDLKVRHVLNSMQQEPRLCFSRV